MKAVKIEGENFHIFQKNFDEILVNFVAYDNIKSHKRPMFHLLSRKQIFGKTTREILIDPAPSLFRVILLYIIFNYFFDGISNFSYRILTNQKRKLMVSNCQLNYTLQENSRNA